MGDIELEEEFAQKRLTRRVLVRLGRFLRPHRRPVLLSMGCEFVWVISFTFNTICIKRALDSLSAGDLHGIGFWAGVLLANAWGRAILVIFELRWIWYGGVQFLNDLRREVFDHIQVLSMRYFDRTKEGRIIARVDRDVESLQQAMLWGPLIFVSAFFCIFVAAALMAYYEWKLFLAVACVGPVLAAASWFFQKQGMRAYRRVRESQSAVTAFIAETVQGVRVLQGFGRERLRREDFGVLARGHADTVVHAALVWNAYLPSISTCYAAGMMVVLGFGGHLVLSGEMLVTELIAFVMLLGQFFWPIEGLGELYNMSLSAAAGAERICLLLDTEPEVRDPAVPRGPEGMRGHLVFEGVDFAYDAGKRGEWSLKDIDFEARPGESVALVGPTGAGKTSIVNLAARFYEPLAGRVLIDGVDLREIRVRDLRSHMGLVPQENFLFTGTVMENLLFGNPAAAEADAVRAVEELGAGAVLGALRDGLRTEVKERGEGLSQGERQLICFARALIADPRILILDEATASVDTHTERLLQDALKRLSRGRTTLIVAHRLSTIRNADNILVVLDGRIAERGRHEELIAGKGRYFELYRELKRKGVMN